MKKFLPLVSCFAILAARCSPKDTTNLTEAGLVEKAKAIQERVITLDTRDDIDPSNFTGETNYTPPGNPLEHVDISSDFDGGGDVDGWNDASETLNVTLELVRRRYTEEQIAALWSGNLLRVLDEVQNVAKKLQAEAKL